MYAGCVAGALQEEDYLKVIADAGFRNIQLVKTKQVHVPDEVLALIAKPDEIANMKMSNAGIYSITVTADR